MDMVQRNHLYAKFQITSNKRLIALRIANLNVGSMRLLTRFSGKELIYAVRMNVDGEVLQLECWKIRNVITNFGGLAQAVLECCRQRQKLIDKIFYVKYVSDRLMMIKLDACEVVLTALLLFSIYFPQSGLTMADIG